MVTSDIDLFALVSGLLGGMALFLFGMDQMSSALKKAAGSRMRTILAQLTKNRFTGVVTGALATAVIQSSTATTVLVVGFITAGLMTMPQSIGVIMGANVGTTITTQIIAFKVTKLAMVLIAGGFGASLIGRRETIKTYGLMVMGIGLIFFGMSVMGDAMAPLRSYQPFVDWMVTMESPILGILAGAAFTAAIHSSGATTGIVIVLASQGLVTLPAGIAIVFGANIGTCITALLATAGKPREALRAAVIHVLFNVVGVLLWLGFIDQLAHIVTLMSPQSPELEGAARMAAEVPRQVANAHTVFNVANTAVLIWFTPLLARLVHWVVPEKPVREDDEVRAKYLDAELLTTPALALDRARLELLNMSDTVTEMMRLIMPALTNGPAEALEAIRRKDDRVDILHGKIVTYLGKISGTAMNEDQTGELLQLLEAANSLESIGDLIETNLVNLGQERLQAGLNISAATKRMLEGFHSAVYRALDAAMQAVTQRSTAAANVVLSMKQDINRMEKTASAHEARRLVADEPNRLPTYAIEVEIIQHLKRIYYFCKRMARTAEDSAGSGVHE